jgi:carboxymethylenebutenolidase
MRQIAIRTADGRCPAYDAGTGPGVLLLIDGIGMRPAMQTMAERLASAGYRVLMPDLFYRLGAYTAYEPAKLFGDPDIRTEWFKRVSAIATPELILRDIEAYLGELAGPVGVTGYCMGGRLAIAAAGTYPDRIVAAAAYHPGNVATDAPDSAHLLAPKIKAEVYVGAASDDATFPIEQQQRLTAAFDAARVRYQLEVYPAKHGWVPSDTPVHDPAAAEKHWQTLEALLARVLR